MCMCFIDTVSDAWLKLLERLELDRQQAIGVRPSCASIMWSVVCRVWVFEHMLKAQQHAAL